MLVAPLIHLALNAALHVFGTPPADLHAIFVLLSGQFDDRAEFSRTIQALVAWPWHVTAYFVIASLLGLLLGRAAQRTVRSWQLDRTFSGLPVRERLALPVRGRDPQ